MLYGEITGFDVNSGSVTPESFWSAITQEYKLALPDLALDDQTKVLDSTFISQPALVDYQHKLIHYFNLLNLEDAQDSKLFFCPQGEPPLNMFGSQTQDNLKELVAYANYGQTVINSGAIATIEKVVGNKFGSWYYDPHPKDPFFHLYYLSNRRRIIGYLKTNKPTDFF
jgi:hypothetical protein